jgi:hypothetical protein
VLLKPRAIYKDPFRGGENILVMCDTYKPPSPADSGHDIKLEALPTNTRQACNIAMEKAKAEEPWFGIEQVQTTPPHDLQIIGPGLDEIQHTIMVVYQWRPPSCSGVPVK